VMEYLSWKEHRGTSKSSRLYPGECLSVEF
jgi:hypothetical protein